MIYPILCEIVLEREAAYIYAYKMIENDMRKNRNIQSTLVLIGNATSFNAMNYPLFAHQGIGYLPFFPLLELLGSSLPPPN
jgi:hypothetical protein